MLDDADFDGRRRRGSSSVCIHAGQGCAMPTRLLVPRARYDEAVELAAAGLRGGAATATPPTPATCMGPLVSQRQRDRVLGYIEQGKAEGARLVTGGGVPAHLRHGLVRRADAASPTSTTR